MRSLESCNARVALSTEPSEKPNNSIAADLSPWARLTLCVPPSGPLKCVFQS
jgi:hypothetical protein